MKTTVSQFEMQTTLRKAGFVCDYFAKGKYPEGWLWFEYGEFPTPLEEAYEKVIRRKSLKNKK